MSDLRNTRTADHLQHIRDVIREQFGSELSYKEGELEQIEERIRLAKLMLQRLRFGVLAQHYGVAGFYPTALDFSEENVGEQSSWMSFEQEFLKRSSPEKEDAISVASGAAGGDGDGDERAVSADGSDRRTPVQSIGEASSYLRREYGAKKEFVLGPVPVKKPEIAPPLVVKDTSQSTDVGDGRTGMIITNSNGEVPDNQLMLTQSINEAPQSTPPSDIHATPTSPKQVSRFYSKQRIIIGNTSQYLHPASSEENANGSTHKWMVYVRGPNEDADISKFVKAVRFFLHPSYHPNDIVRVTRPPFHLIRLGWGEFPVRVQLEFCDRRNKPVDIIHNLVLDRTHTGQQTLGAETVVDLDINPNRKEGLSLVGGANGLSHPLLNGHLATDEDISPAPANDVGKLSIGQNMIKSLSREESLVNMKMATIEEERDADLTSRTDDKLSTHSAKSSECNDSYQAGSSSHLEAPSLTTPSVTPTILDALPPQVMTTNLEKCLHSAVRVVPLYGRPSGSDDFHLTACTVDQFKSWSVGRRRAAEWMRALAVKRHVERKLRLTTSLLSTKQVMQWCRRNGYTLLDPCTPTGVGFCKYCGCQLEASSAATGSLAVGGSEETRAEEEKRNLDHLRVHERCREIYEGGSGLNESASVDMEIDSETEGAAPLEERPATTTTSFKHLSSLSESQELFVNLIQAQERIEKAEAGHIEEDEVDIETQPGCTSARARAYEHPVPRLRVPQTPELKWVQRTASSIGIHIYPAVIDRMYAHVVEHMVYMSCTRFLKAILMQSLQEAGRKVEGDLSSERVLTPLHVYQAVQSLHQCDFLTNKHLGLEVKGRGIVGGASDEELSSSCSSSDDDA